MIFSKQKQFCRICGNEFSEVMQGLAGKALCSTKCYDEYDWRRTLSTLGKEYYPHPSRDTKVK